MMVRYGCSEEAWHGWAGYLERMIAATGARRILEVGGGANPTISLDAVARQGLEYTVLDISAAELAKAPEGYIKLQGDIASAGLELPGNYDLIFSKMLAEHLPNGEVFHRNVHGLLRRGGIACHFFPTLYAPPFVLNRLLPERLADSVLRLLQRGRDQAGRHAKFPAYYSWCRGPTKVQIRRFEGLGYQVKEYIGFFGHEGYYLKIPPVARVHRAIANWLTINPASWLTSFAYVTLQKA